MVRPKATVCYWLWIHPFAAIHERPFSPRKAHTTVPTSVIRLRPASQRQSGIGREYGTFGIEAVMEPKAVLGVL
ncbi:hypothetical protein A9762_15570 [Pandoraea sp. ISTKB]|nr:hypothetical protein A9762_15570 [Pandoraea sp. ISTKB]